MLVRMQASGADLLVCDYDQRTAMHLAASTGELACLKYLISVAKRADRMKEMFTARDRFGNRPVDDSTREGHLNCATALEAAFKYAISPIQIAIPVENYSFPTGREGQKKVSPTLASFRRANRRRSETGKLVRLSPAFRDRVSPRNQISPKDRADGGSS
jgi:hypothetical protein